MRLRAWQSASNLSPMSVALEPRPSWCNHRAGGAGAGAVVAVVAEVVVLGRGGGHL